MGRPISSSSSEYRPQQGVFSAGDLDTTAASLLRQYRRVLPAPAPGPPEECGLKRRCSVFDIVRQDSEHAIAGAVSVPACIAHALQNAPFADATWAFPDTEIIGLAHPQIVLIRPQAVGPTIIADLRALGGPLRVIEVQGQCSPDSLAQMFETNVPGIRGRIQAGRVVARVKSANWPASEARRLPLGTAIDISAGVGTALALPIGVGISQRAIAALGLPQLYRGAIYVGGPGLQTMSFPLQRFDSLSQALAAIWDGVLASAPARRPDSFLFGATQPAVRGDTIRLTLTLLCTPCREERVVWLDLTSIGGPLRVVLMPSVATLDDVGLSGHHAYLNGVQWQGTQYLTHGAIVQVTSVAVPPAHMHLSALWNAIPDLAALSSPAAFPYANHLMASFEGPTAFEPYFVDQQLALREGRGLNSRTPLCLLLAPGLADVFSLGHSIPSLRAVADFAQTTLIDLYGPGILVDLGIASGEYTVYAFRPADLPGGLSFLVHRSGGLRVGVTVDRTLDTFGPEYFTSQSVGLGEAVGNIGRVAVDGLSVDDRPSIELPTDSFTATFLATNAQPEGEPEAEAASSSAAAHALELAWSLFLPFDVLQEAFPPLHFWQLLIIMGVLYVPALVNGLPVLELQGPLLLGLLSPIFLNPLLFGWSQSPPPVLRLLFKNMSALLVAQRNLTIASLLFLMPCGMYLRTRFLVTTLTWFACRRPLLRLPFLTQVGLDRLLRYSRFLSLNLSCCALVPCVPLSLMPVLLARGSSRSKLLLLPLRRSCWIERRCSWGMSLQQPKGRKASNAFLMRWHGHFRLKDS